MQTVDKVQCVIDFLTEASNDDEGCELGIDDVTAIIGDLTIIKNEIQIIKREEALRTFGDKAERVKDRED